MIQQLLLVLLYICENKLSRYSLQSNLAQYLELSQLISTEDSESQLRITLVMQGRKKFEEQLKFIRSTEITAHAALIKHFIEVYDIRFFEQH